MSVSALNLDTDGTILLAGSSAGRHLAVARVAAEGGAADPARDLILGSTSAVLDADLYADRLVVVGYAYPGAHSIGVAVRFLV
jgi:hypothetical protein